MKTDYNQTSMLDMVFEYRNKSYGAYVLRRDHDKSLKTAMAFSFSAIFILLTGNFIAERIKDIPQQHSGPEVTIDIKNVTLSKKPPVVEQKQPEQKTQPKPKPTIKNTPLNVVANNEVMKDSIPTVEDLKNLESGVTDNRTAANDGLAGDGGKGTGNSFEPIHDPAPVSSEPTSFPDVMPEFPGGEGKLLQFLADHTEYPPMEHDAGITGRVTAEVTINTDGRITDVHILKSPSPGFSKEVTRVAKLIPPFKPGMQAGRPVRVRMVMPFTFRITNN